VFNNDWPPVRSTNDIKRFLVCTTSSGITIFFSIFIFKHLIQNDNLLIQFFQSTKKHYHPAASCLLQLLEDKDAAVPFLKTIIDLSFKSPICNHVVWCVFEHE